MTRQEPALHHIQLLTEAVHNMLGSHPNFTRITRQTPPLEHLDPDRFNRIEVQLEGLQYTISIFRSGAEAEKVEDEPVLLSPPKFRSDFRESNPKLHRMYVRYALEEIEIVKQMVDELHQMSRVSATIIAGEAWAAVRGYITTEAAWFEAAALLIAGVDTAPYFREEPE